MNVPSPYLPAARLFAAELAEAKADEQDTRKFKTETGSFGKEIAYIGALIDIIKSGERIVSLRLSDPTGVCTAYLNSKDRELQNQAKELDVPSFLYIYGTLRVSEDTKFVSEITISILKPVTKDTRNSWVLQTAEDTLSRLQNSTDNEEFKQKIIGVIETVKPKEQAPVLSDEDIFEVIRSLYEGKSAPRDKVIDALKSHGMTKQQAQETIARLMEEGDIYAPKPDLLKVL